MFRNFVIGYILGATVITSIAATIEVRNHPSLEPVSCQLTQEQIQAGIDSGGLTIDR